jgi:hypothetical protein
MSSKTTIIEQPLERSMSEEGQTRRLAQINQPEYGNRPRLGRWTHQNRQGFRPFTFFLMARFPR